MRDILRLPIGLVNEDISAVTGLLNFQLAISDPFIHRQVLSILEYFVIVIISVPETGRFLGEVYQMKSVVLRSIISLAD